jgi:hypothetical protein
VLILFHTGFLTEQIHFPNCRLYFLHTSIALHILTNLKYITIVVQELLTLPVQQMPRPGLKWDRVAQSLVFCIILCQPVFLILSFIAYIVLSVLRLKVSDYSIWNLPSFNTHYTCFNTIRKYQNTQQCLYLQLPMYLQVHSRGPGFRRRMMFWMAR